MKNMKAQVAAKAELKEVLTEIQKSFACGTKERVFELVGFGFNALKTFSYKEAKHDDNYLGILAVLYDLDAVVDGCVDEAEVPSLLREGFECIEAL